jgi:hypothetical protein
VEALRRSARVISAVLIHRLSTRKRARGIGNKVPLKRRDAAAIVLRKNFVTAAPRHRAIFEATRAEFLRQTSTIPIANLTVRLRMLQRLSAQAERQGNIALAAQLVQQAAKEIGGAFTRRREVTGGNGGPIEAANRAVQMTSTEFRAIAHEVAREA